MEFEMTQPSGFLVLFIRENYLLCGFSFSELTYMKNEKNI